jgi:hypothetical protein
MNSGLELLGFAAAPARAGESTTQTTHPEFVLMVFSSTNLV